MVEVKLHDIGEGMTEADINCYLVKVGDIVKADDPLIEVQTDKMTAEIPAPKSGVIKQILLSPGTTVKVGTTLLIMDDLHSENTYTDSNGPSEQAKSRSKLKIISEEIGKKMTQSKRILATPYTRKIARENNVDIHEIGGSGPAGRITDDDVLGFIKARNENASSETTIHAIQSPRQGDSYHRKISEKTTTDTIPFRGRRKQIAKKMAQSLYTIPHCTHFEEVDVSELISFREELKSQERSISATAFFIKAISICLKEFPIFNSQLNEEKEEIQLVKDHHIGLAIDTKEGLIVPVIEHVNLKTLKEINQEMKRLTQLALEDSLVLKDISGGTFTISNVGPLGGSIGATPIIQHPQTALVSFHKTKKRPVISENDEIVIRSIMNISMSFDHRVADGATAVLFTNRLTELIENPKMLLLELV